MALECKFDFSDTIRFQAALHRVEKIPQKAVNKAAGKGATIAGKAIRAAAPRGDTNQLRKGFKRKAERTRVKGRKVYYYAMDEGKNDIFQKPIPANPGNPGARKSDWKHAYYPASIEYGFLTRSQGGGITYVKGTHFARDSAEQVRPQVNRTVIRVLTEELNKEWRK